MSLDNKLLVITEVQRELREMFEKVSSTGDGGGGDGGERRLDRLQARFDKFTDDMSTTKQDIATLKERVAHLPTKEFIIKALMGSLAVIAGMIAFAEKLQALVK